MNLNLITNISLIRSRFIVGKLLRNNMLPKQLCSEYVVIDSKNLDCESNQQMLLGKQF